MGMNLLDLADRCEAASGEYDPELCSLIHDVLPEPKCVQPPNYCASIDAAMMLVPNGDGHWPQLIYSGVNPNNPGKQKCRYEIWQKGSAKPARSNAATPALALCAAAIRALAEQVGE